MSKSMSKLTTQPLSSADLQLFVTNAEAGVNEARAQWQAAKDKLDTDFQSLTIAADEVGISQLRKAIREALRNFENARDDHERLKQQLQKALQAEAAANTAERLVEAKRKGAAWQNDVEALQYVLAEVAATYEKCCESGLAFRTALPNELGESESTMLWGAATLAQAAQLFMYGLTGGRFAARSMGSPWQVVQGPDLRARARENVRRALAKQPNPIPDPPKAA